MAEKLNDLIAARTEQPAPANADKLPLLDSADAHKFRWLSWSGLLARLSALFEPAGASDAAVTAHAAAADDHAQYYNQARGDARYSLTGHAHTGTYEPAGAVSAHAVAADPHPGYTTAAELATALTAKADASHTQAASTITDLAEAVDDRVAALLVAGANVTLSYNDSAGTLTVASSGGAGYTDEQAQDAVGGILTDSQTVDFTYDDVAGTITAAAKSQQSITSDASGLKLVGDAAVPGNSQLYGTNASGAKGWYANPTAIRVVNAAIASGAVAADAAGSSDVIVKLTQNAAISNVAPSNVPTVCRMTFEIDQAAGGPWAFPLSAWPAGTVASSYYIYPAGKTLLWLSTFDGGASWVLECNAPLSLTLPQASAAGAITVDADGIGDVVVNLTLTGDITTITRQNIPTNCRIRYETTQGAGGPWVIKDSAWGSGAIVPFYITSATGKTVITWTTTDGGATATVEGSVNNAGAIKMPAGRYVDTSVLAVGLSTVAGAAGRIDVARFVPEYDLTVDRLGVYVTTGVAAATGRVVIYGANANNEPDARLFFPADDLNLATSSVFVEHTASFTFKKGVLYYVGFLHGSTATIHGIQGYTLPSLGFSGPTSSSPGCVIRQTVTYPNAPANFGFLPAQITASAAPSIKMRAA